MTDEFKREEEFLLDDPEEVDVPADDESDDEEDDAAEPAADEE